MNITPGIDRFTWGEIIYNPQARLGPRFQPHYQLVLVHGGSVEVHVDGQPHRVGAGEVIFLVPGHWEDFRFSDAGPTHHSYVHGILGEDEDSWAPLRRQGGRVVSASDRLLGLMRELLGCGEPRDPVRLSLSLALATALFLEFFDCAGFSLGEERPRHPALERAHRFMSANFARSLTLPAIAKAAGLSPQHLTRLFLQETGLTPVRHLWRLREDEGRRLLRDTGLTIAEIAAACGFQSPFHFSRRLRARFGAPPRALRQADWGRG